MKFVVLVLCFIYCANAASLKADTCPESPVLPQFDASRFLGKWYEIQRFRQDFQDNLKCVTAEYGLLNSTFISILNSGVNVFTGQVDSITGYGWAPNPAVPNQLTIRLRIPIPGVFIENEGKYDVWETDYENYALVYACSRKLPQNVKTESAWILSRKPTLDEATITRLVRILAAKNINIGLFEVLPQDCDRN